MNKETMQAIIRLGQNENPLGPSPKVIRAIQENLDKVHLYPEPHSHSLKALLAEKLGLQPENVFVSSGLVEALDILISNMVGVKENMIIGDITFVAYKLLAKVKKVNVRFSKMPGYRIDVDDLLSLCDENTKLIIIANPNNPTGTMISEDELVKLLDHVPPTTYVVADEAYWEYVSDPQFPNSLALQKKYRNLIVMRTFSKIYGLAGLRVGYTLAAPEIINQFDLFQGPFTVNQVASAAVKAAVEDPEYIETCAQLNVQNRRFLAEELSRLNLQIVPSQSNFIYLPFDTQPERDQVHDRLEARGILTRKMELFGDDKALRITVGTAGHIEKIIKALEG